MRAHNVVRRGGTANDVPNGVTTPPAFAVRQASVAYDASPVLREVTFDVAAGEVIAIMGANGSGKSTLLRALLGIVPLTVGTIAVHGAPLRGFRQWRRLGYVPQRLTVGGGVPATVAETVAAGRLAHKRGWPYATARDRAAVDRALDDVDLRSRAGDAVAELSGGQQQRALIARALASEPDTLLMDEPMAGVDAANQRALAHTLSGLSNRGHTIVLVLHELGPLEPLIDRAVVLSHGQVVHDGAPPRPVGECARPGHDHIHPHAEPDSGGLSMPSVEGPRLD